MSSVLVPTDVLKAGEPCTFVFTIKSSIGSVVGNSVAVTNTFPEIRSLGSTFACQPKQVGKRGQALRRNQGKAGYGAVYWRYPLTPNCGRRRPARIYKTPCCSIRKIALSAMPAIGTELPFLLFSDKVTSGFTTL